MHVIEGLTSIQGFAGLQAVDRPPACSLVVGALHPVDDTIIPEFLATMLYSDDARPALWCTTILANKYGEDKQP